MRSVTRIRFGPFFGSLGVIASCQACDWDRDTLKNEAANSGTALDAIVGRFDRNPALYYEVRASRVAKELEKNPKQPALYDDIAVAYDKLRNPAEAINWINRKAPYLGDDSDQAYRFYANRGTFHAHLWIANKRQGNAIDTAIADIEQAIKINPDAHFGREKAQLKLLKSLKENSANWLNNFSDQDLKGIAGLIELGNAWGRIAPAGQPDAPTPRSGIAGTPERPSLSDSNRELRFL
jgi:tetratricopeptide (TPR) repeat protein